MAFWPFPFPSQSVKGLDTFCRVWGFIGRFKKLRRNIYSGVEKMPDELMSAIRFRTTSNDGIPQYSYISRKPEALGVELNNAARSRLGDVLYLEIQKGEEEMKTYHNFNRRSEGLWHTQID